MPAIFETKALPSKPFSRRAKWNADSWAWEILSCTLSIVTTVTVGVVVFIYDGKPVPRLPYNLGLNSVISVIGTVSKSALLLTITSCISQYKWVNFTDVRSLQDLLLHDDASRGPWGSFMLLLNRKGLYWVKLAALATIVSMGLDPAYQALIKIEQRPEYRYDPGAIVKRALNFEGTNYFASNENAYFSAVWYRDIINAISSEAVLETKPSCSTGNCTFPIFSSLAFCSNCVDITQFLQQHSNCSQHEAVQTETYQFEGKIVKCIYRLPPSISERNHSYPDDWNDTSTIEIAWIIKKDAQKSVAENIEPPSFLNLFLTGGNYSEPFQSSDGANISSHTATMALIKFAPQTDFASVGYLSTAHLCALSVCAKKYNMSMTSGLFRTEIVSTSYSEFGGPTLIDQKNAGNPSYNFTFSDDLNNDFTVNSYLINTISIPSTLNNTISGHSNDTISDDSSSGDPSSSYSIVPIFFDLASGDPSSGDGYSFDVDSDHSLSDHTLSAYAISDDPSFRDPIADHPNFTVAFSVEDKLMEVLQQTFGGVIRTNYDLLTASNWFADPTTMYLSGLNTSTNISKTMDRVAAAMSNRLRDLSNVTVQGQSEFLELYIRVSWWWLLLPSLIGVFATIFLISIAITTRKYKVPIWKTSELALLFHGLDLSPLGGDSVEMLKASEMEDIASALQVKFDRDSERGGVPKLERMPEQEA